MDQTLTLAVHQNDPELPYSIPPRPLRAWDTNAPDESQRFDPLAQQAVDDWDAEFDAGLDSPADGFPDPRMPTVPATPPTTTPMIRLTAGRRRPSGPTPRRSWGSCSSSMPREPARRKQASSRLTPSWNRPAGRGAVSLLADGRRPRPGPGSSMRGSTRRPCGSGATRRRDRRRLCPLTRRSGASTPWPSLTARKARPRP